MKTELVIYPVNGDRSNYNYIDLEEDFSIPLNLSVQDIMASTIKQQSSYSNTINIPSTDNNNKIFKHLYDINNQNKLKYSKAYDCRVFQNKVEVFAGKFEIEQTSTSTGSLVYKCRVYSTPVDLLTKLGELNLYNDLVNFYSPTVHEKNYSNVTGSWSHTYLDKYYYPFLDDGLIDSGITSFLCKDIDNFKPALFVKPIFDELFKMVGFTYESDFLESDVFKKLVMINYPDIKYNETDKLRTDIEAGAKWSVVGNSNYNYANPPALTDQNPSEYYSIGLSYPIELGDGFWNPGWLRPTQLQMATIIKNGTDTPYSNNFYYCKIGGNYTFNLSGLVYIKINPGQSQSYMFTRQGQVLVNIFYIIYNEDGSIKLDSNSIGQTFSRTQAMNQIYKSNISGFEVLNESIDYTYSVNLNVGEYIGFYVTENVPSRTTDNIDDQFLFSEDDSSGSYLALSFFMAVNFSNLLLSISLNDNREKEFTTIYPNEYLPNMKASDFFVEILRFFNLFVLPDEFEPTKLYIMPRDEFYSSTKYLDWTNKIDTKKEILNERISDVPDYILNFKYTDDTDYYNKLYTASYAKQYGEFYEKGSNNIEGDKILKIQSTFSPTVLTDYVNGRYVGIYLSSIRKYDDKGNLTTGLNKRLLFYGGYIADDGGAPSYSRIGVKYNNHQSISTFVNNLTDNYTIYPYTSHMLLPPGESGENLDLCWYYPETRYFNGSVTSNNLYNKYYKKQYAEYTDVNAVMKTAEFYLDEVDINQFDFSNLIFLKDEFGGQYYRVNKIIEYTGQGTCKVQMFSVVDVDIDYDLIITGTTSTTPESPSTNIDKIEAGKDEIIGSNSFNLVDKVDAGTDLVIDLGASYNILNKIDAGTDIIL